MTPAQMTAILDEIDEADAINLMIRIEQKFQMRGCTYQRCDVNDRFRNHVEMYGEPVRDMTDAEWDRFRDSWLWRKGYADVMGSGMTEAIDDALEECGFFGRDAA